MAKKRIFVSFVYDDDRNYKNLLVAWDKNDDFDFEMYDASVTVAVNSTNATYIKSIIKPRIERATHLLCIVGKNTHKSDWCAWEIQTATELKKKLIGVKIDKCYTSPADLLNNGAKWALAFTFDSIKAAVDAA